MKYKPAPDLQGLTDALLIAARHMLGGKDPDFDLVITAMRRDETGGSVATVVSGEHRAAIQRSIKLLKHWLATNCGGPLGS
jgi:hypothetical protein